MSDTLDGRKGRSRATQARLLEAAGKLFAAHGFAATTLEALAAESGANKALVRYHFGGKAGLYNAVLRESIQVGLELMQPLRANDEPAPARLDAFIDALGLLLERRPHFAPMVVREWMSGGAHMDAEVFQALGEFFQLDREILEQGCAAGELRDLDPHAAHLSLIGSIVFFQVSQPVRDQRGGEMSAPRLERSAYLEHVKETFRRGLAR